MRPALVTRLLAACALASALTTLAAPATRAATVSVQLPTVTVAPGATIDVPIATNPSPAGLGISAVDYRVAYAANVVQSVQVLNDGWLATLGTPFVNATATQLTVSMAGITPTTSALTTMNTLRIVIKPSAPIGTDMPLGFTLCRFNEGTPAVTTVDGLIRVRGGLAVDGTGAAALAFAPPSPNPAARVSRLAFTLPRAMPVRLDVFAVDGALVRSLTAGTLAAGDHAAAWDLRDAKGIAVAQGVYLARLVTPLGTLERRIVALH